MGVPDSVLSVVLRYSRPVLVLSHLHGDHFDQLVAEKLRKDLPIVSNPHACDGLKKQGHTSLFPLQTWEKIQIVKEGSGGDEIIITAMPGKHTLLPLVVEQLSNMTGIHVLPPVMGSMVTFKSQDTKGDAKKYNLYISGDTLYYDELKASIDNGKWVRCTDVRTAFIGDTRKVP